MRTDPLTREEVVSVIDGHARARRVPMFIHFWTNPDAFGDRMDTYWRPGEGRCMITAGNGITGDCPIASLEAFLDETFRYGKKGAIRTTHAKRQGSS